VNLPAKSKMIAPRYRGITEEQVPTLEKDGVKIKVIAGRIDETEGPVRDLIVDVEYYDVELEAEKAFKHTTNRDCTAFVYAFEGSAYSHNALIKPEHCAAFGDGDIVNIRTKSGTRFLFVKGRPLKEPVAWGGPFVMNTEEELALAFQELEEGTFIKTGKTVKPSTDFYRE
jgi:redox-sensitive bicupin YhaK (pirin superfamily)